MIREAHDAHAQAGGLDDGGRTGGTLVGAGARPGDACAPKMVERVEESLAPVVERMVVRDRDAAHAELCQRIHCVRGSPEEERLRRVGPPRPVLRDGALEIEDEQVSLAR
jgi:hypothetical protein